MALFLITGSLNAYFNVGYSQHNKENIGNFHLLAEVKTDTVG